MPFEKALLRRSAKPNRFDLDEEDVRTGGTEKDYLPVIAKTILTKDLRFKDAVLKIYRHVLANPLDETH